MVSLKEIKKGILIGCGFLIVVMPILVVAGVYASPYAQQVNTNYKFAPESSLIYTFETKDIDSNTITSSLGKSSNSISRVIKNYRTSDGKIIDIVEFDKVGLTTTQQLSLQSIYPNKIITGMDKLP